MKKQEKNSVNFPKYEAELSFDDMRDILNYRVSNVIEVDYGGQKGKISQVSEFDIALFALRLGLISVEGEKVTEDNFDELLKKHLENYQADMILLYYDMWGNCTKKK